MNDLFKIVSQSPVLRRAPGGGLVDAMEVVFTTKRSGITGKVEIPTSAYSADEVARVVADQAGLLESVQEL